VSYPIRLLETGFRDCFYNMGLDEALLESVAAGAMPALRFYGWNPPAVSIGCFQGLAEEVDVEACKRRGFDITRRISGGGAVLHKSELTYSIILPLAHPLAKKDLNESYIMLCAGLLEGLRLLGIRAVFSGINDILAGGKKVSGSAQTRRLGCLLLHGTVLLDSDIDEMFEALKVPQEKMKGKTLSAGTAEVKERVTDVKTLLGRALPFDEAVQVFREGFARAIGLEYIASAPLPHEEKRAAELAEEKFSTKEWIYKL
jgi:lipoate-protein ligase A